ncbi:MAG: ABC transporter permease [Bosea sp. (in: a-proteobacteria)]
MRFVSDILAMMRKEWRVLLSEPVMIGLLIYAFAFAVMLAGSTHGTSVSNASIAIVDQDHTTLTERIGQVLRKPFFRAPQLLDASEVDLAMTQGRVTFALQIPPHFTADLMAGRKPKLELLVDATAMTQAFIGAGYIDTFVRDEIAEYLRGRIPTSTALPEANVRARFNPNLDGSRFSGIMELAQMITLIGIVLTGSAVLRERERGTLEHLLVLPVRASAILLSKILANVVVMLICVSLSLRLVVEGALGIEVVGSIPLFMLGAGLYMFSVTATGVFLALAVRSTQEFGLVCLIVIMPMMVLSGVMTPIENMPWYLRGLMMILPSPHFVRFSADVAFRGADLSTVWPTLLTMAVIGLVFMTGAIAVFRLAMNRANA